MRPRRQQAASRPTTRARHPGGAVPAVAHPTMRSQLPRRAKANGSPTLLCARAYGRIPQPQAGPARVGAVLISGARTMRLSVAMLRSILIGTAAGAVGTCALNVVTYLDMTLRGRPSSDVPAQTAGKIAAAVGVDLDPHNPQQTKSEREEQVEARKSGLGALMGFGVGLKLG